MITKETKKELIQKFGKNDKDSGSSSVQIAILSAKINDLSTHFEANKHDFASKRGLMQMIGKRRSLLRYLQNTNQAEYQRVLADLNLRK